MKLAVCISGQPRFFKSSYPSLKKHVLDKYDCDVFIFTWKKTDNSEVGLMNSWRYPDEGTIAEYIDLYKPKAFLSWDYSDAVEKHYVTLENKYGLIRQDNPVRRYLAMLQGIEMSFSLSQRKYVDLNFFQEPYDFYVRTRPDVIYKDFHLPTNKKMLIDHYGNGLHPNATGDVLAIGNRYEMSRYSWLSDWVERYAKQGLSPDTQILLEHHLKSQVTDYEICHFVEQIIRPQKWLP